MFNSYVKLKKQEKELKQNEIKSIEQCKDQWFWISLVPLISLCWLVIYYFLELTLFIEGMEDLIPQFDKGFDIFIIVYYIFSFIRLILAIVASLAKHKIKKQIIKNNELIKKYENKNQYFFPMYRDLKDKLKKDYLFSRDELTFAMNITNIYKTKMNYPSINNFNIYN